mgnify:CR=1 FL=1
MKKEDLISFMKEIAAELQRRGNLGTAHVYRSSLNAIRTFLGSDKMPFRQLTPEWLKRFENSLRDAVGTQCLLICAPCGRSITVRLASGKQRMCLIYSVRFTRVQGRTISGHWTMRT